MPLVNYCKKCKAETPLGESCPYCGGKLAQTGEQISFGVMCRPEKEWFAWNNLLRIVLPVWLLVFVIVVAAEGADLARIENEIKTMPNYFADYDTTVTFITKEELMRDHKGMPHGGSVIRNGTTGKDGENTHTVEFSLSLDSNPEFTGSVLLAYARAVYRMRGMGTTGCITVFDVPPVMLSPLSREEMRKSML